MRKDQKREIRYASAKERAEKHDQGTVSKALKLPKGAKLFGFRKKGTEKLDILPYIVGKGNPFADEGLLHYERTYYVHSQVGPDNDTVPCLKAIFKKPCPICEHGERLRRQGEPWEAQKEFKPKERQLFNLIDLNNPQEGVQILEYNHWFFGKVLDEKVQLADEEDKYEQFSHLKGGYTLKVAVSPENFQGRAFFKPTSIEFRARKDYPEDILEQVYCLDDLVREMRYEEIQKLFDAMLPPSSSISMAALSAPNGRGRTLVPRPAQAVDEDEDEDEPLVKPGVATKTAPASLGKWKLGDFVLYRNLECEIKEVDLEGKRLSIEDEDGNDYWVTDFTKLKSLDKDEEPTPSRRAVPDRDEEDEDDDQEDQTEEGVYEEEDEDDPPPPSKKRR